VGFIPKIGIFEFFTNLFQAFSLFFVVKDTPSGLLLALEAL
jgi:hypothetical protein